MAFVVGPMEPATKRGLAEVLNSSAAWRASSAERWLSRCASAARPYSARTMGALPKLLVSTMSEPASKYLRWMSRTTSGRVRTRFSLQPSSEAPPKSSAVRLRCCSMVPMAPSSTRMRCDSRSRRALADSVRLRMAEKVASSLVSGRGVESEAEALHTPLTSFYPCFPQGTNQLALNGAFSGLNGDFEGANEIG